MIIGTAKANRMRMILCQGGIRSPRVLKCVITINKEKTITTGNAVVIFCNNPKVIQNKNNSVERQVGISSIRSMAYGIAAKVKKVAAVSIIKVRPQNKYNGLDHNKAVNTQGTSGGRRNRRAIPKAGAPQANKKNKLTNRPTGSRGKPPIDTTKATMD